jgi:transposase
MLTQEDDVEIHALRKKGWSISAIARHTGRDRKTVRAYLEGRGGRDTRPQERASCLDPYREFLAQRFVDDPHVTAAVLFDELVEAQFDRSYPTLVRELRRLGLRPVCTTCEHHKGTDPTVRIEHPAGEELQIDWLELHDTPWGRPVYVLVGALSHSGRFRTAVCEQMTIGHVAQGMHRIVEQLGGTAKVWRVDRMATAVIPGTDRLNPQFAQIAKHYGVEVAICPPRRAQRKGVVEKAVQYLTGRWWRTMRAGDPVAAQRTLDMWCEKVADRRKRPGGTTVGEQGAAEPLMPVPPVAFPIVVVETRKVSRTALVAYDGNHYSVTAGLIGRQIEVRLQIDQPFLELHTADGGLIARHRRAPGGAGQTIRTTAHDEELQKAVLEAFTTDKPCRRKTNRPASDRALALLHRASRDTAADRVEISLQPYAQLTEPSPRALAGATG